MSKRDQLHYLDIALHSLRKEEGFAPTLTKDSQGYVIGYGHNVVTRGIKRHQADYLLDDETRENAFQIHKRWPLFKFLSPQRKAVLIEMAYQMGLDGLAGFRKMWEAIHAGDFSTAAAEMLDSQWAKQTPARAKRLAARMRKG